MSDSDFSVTILGSSAALPANHRNPSAQVLFSNQHIYLIDCGEGTQLQLRKFRVKMQRIKAVFISHMHGDHYFGLPGLLNSMNLLGRKTGLTIVCPSELESIIDLQMKAGKSQFQFPIQYVFTNDVQAEGQESLYSDAQIEVTGFLLKHRIRCTGFVFRQQPKLRSYLPEVGEQYNIPLHAIPAIKKGDNYVAKDGSIVPNATLTHAAPEPRSYAYCTDSLPIHRTVLNVSGVKCLYHEATFMEQEAERAKSTYHSTAKQAARIAHEAGVEKLIIGHFSARYDDLSKLLSEAKSSFPETYLAVEGKSVDI